MSKKSTEYNSIDVSIRLMDSMSVAIENMIEEIRKPVDQEITGSARKAELQSIKQTAIDCKELIIERQKLSEMIKEFKTNGTFDNTSSDFSGGFAEQYSAKRK